MCAFERSKKGMELNMNKIKEIFNNLDKTDLKIMKTGLKISFGILVISLVFLCTYLLFIHNLFLYNLGLSIFKFSSYIAVEFIVCGIIVDLIYKQVNT